MPGPVPRPNCRGDERRENVKKAPSFRISFVTILIMSLMLGTACGPHPFPEMVAWFQSIIGKEAKKQMVSRNNVG